MTPPPVDDQAKIVRMEEGAARRWTAPLPPPPEPVRSPLCAGSILCTPDPLHWISLSRRKVLARSTSSKAFPLAEAGDSAKQYIDIKRLEQDVYPVTIEQAGPLPHFLHGAGA